MFLIKRDNLPLMTTIPEKRAKYEQWGVNNKLYHIVCVRYSFLGGNYTS